MKPFLIALILTLPVASATFAQLEAIGTRFQQLDSNGDGQLSAEEVKKAPLTIQRLLRGADQNGDGLLTLAEVQAHLGKPAGPTAASAPAPKPDPIREAPRILAPNAVGIGRMVPNVTLKTLDGQTITLKDAVGQKGLVIAFTNTTCPICQKYGPTLTRLQETLAAKGIKMLFVNPTASESLNAMQGFVKTHQLSGPYVHDREGIFARTLEATSTAEVFLLDPQRTIVYRGAIDDQYGLGYSHDAPKRPYLLDAVTALLADRPIQPAATTAPGCELDLSDAPGVSVSVTYHNRISRIIQTHCLECHREGGVGPFSLETYDQVVAQAGMIRKVVERGTMPPWFAAPAEAGQRSAWANDRRLPAADKADLLTWLGSGKPLGDPADAPRPRIYPDGWLIGPPDAVFEFPQAVAVKANGTMPYQNITIETHLTEDKWVKAVEVRPSAREVVHHVLVFVLPPGNDKAGQLRDTAADERRGFFAAYVPGQSVLTYPDGFAKRLPKGSRLRFQMHYTPNGTATFDKTRIGMVFADKTPDYEVHVVGIANPRLSIPPGAENHAETATLRVPFPATALGFLPHMHLRGKAFRYEITTPDGKTETLLDIPHYDFNWQLYYRLAEPRPLPPGSIIQATGWYDNSEKNPANPDPNKTVRWGPQTTDEMMLGYLEYYLPIGTADRIMGNTLGDRLNAAALFPLLDANGDGQISRAEYDAFVKRFPRLRDHPDEVRLLFDRLDTDKDGALTRSELGKLTPR